LTNSTIVEPTPSGITITYNEAEDIIEAVAEAKARQFKKIAWLDSDDLKQEVRSKCYRTLPRWDPNRADLYTFLSKCAENRLRDLRRGLLYKHNKPCFRCQFWDEDKYKSGQHDCTIFRDKYDCDKYRRHEQYVYLKISVNNPITIDENRISDNKFERIVERSELIEFVYDRLDPYYTSLFISFANANFDLKAISPKERSSFCEIIVEILQEFQEE
jgi:hypothetical protein